MPLPPVFFARRADIVAPDLLGKILVHHLPDGDLRGRIVEVEAYLGLSDPGSHAYRGPTPRAAIMFGPPGRLYAYRSYGIHVCANVVCDADGVAAAVLLRAAEPIEGIDSMVLRRGRTTHLATGPGNLCRAFGITLAHNGLDLATGAISIEDDGTHPHQIGRSVRVGLTHGADLPLRFYIADSLHV